MKDIKESKFFNRTDNNINALIQADVRVLENLHNSIKRIHQKILDIKEEVKELKQIKKYREDNNIQIEEKIKLFDSK